MSGLEDRCVSFHEAAMGTGKSKGAVKEIATLRRFLHKNQNQRFIDKATARLSDTIMLYAHDKQLSADDREGLLEDALKMPFTVFSTKQKKAMLKTLEDIRGGRQTSGDGTTSTTASNSKKQTVVLSIMDIDENNDTVHLMTLTGDETFETPLSSLAPALAQQVQNALDDTEESVEVQAMMVQGSDGVEIVALHTTAET